MSKLTLHLQSCPDWVPEFVARSGIGWIKWIDPPVEQPAWAAGVKVIGRTYEPDEVSNARIWLGKYGAREWFTRWAEFYAARPWVHCWEGPNEPQPMSDPAFRAKLNEFTVELAELMHLAGRRLVGMNWSVGWPDIGTAAEMGPGVQACDYLGLHEYSAPTMQQEQGFLCLRYRRTVQELAESGYIVPPILVTECGIDGGVIGVPKTGWRTYCDNFSWYLDQLKWYSGEIDMEVEAATIFTVCSWDWQDFAIGEAEAMPLADWIASDEPPAPPDHSRGIDVSQWQGEIDWQAVADSGIEFAIIRATVGDADDPYWQENYRKATEAGLLLGAYHYLQAGVGGQAGTFARAVAGKDLPLGCWADIEDDELTADKCAAFFQYADPQIEQPIGIYTSKSKFDRFGVPSWAAGRKLWVADWRDVDSPALPLAWTEWEFWQQTSDGAVPGIVGRVDLDVYNGTFEQEVEPVAVKVFDAEGNEQTWQWAVDRYGVRLAEAAPPEGATVYRLTELRQKIGPCGQIVKVIDEEGNPIEGVAVLQGWVDGVDLPDDAAPMLVEGIHEQPDGKPNKGDGGFTNSDGLFGWGWGPGEQYMPAEQEGAHWYWVMDEYTEVPMGFGWLFGSDHDTLNITFTKTVADTPLPPEPPEPEPGDDLAEVLARLERIEAKVDEIRAHFA